MTNKVEIQSTRIYFQFVHGAEARNQAVNALSWLERERRDRRWLQEDILEIVVCLLHQNKPENDEQDGSNAESICVWEIAMCLLENGRTL